MGQPVITEAFKEDSLVFQAIRSARANYAVYKNASAPKIDSRENFVNSASARRSEIDAAIQCGLLKRASSGRLYIQLDPQIIDRPRDGYANLSMQEAA